MTNAAKPITLFEADDPVTTYTTPLTYNYTLKGCNIKSELSDNVTVWGAFNKNSSYKYEKSSADGLYLTFTAPLTAEAPSLTVAADGKTYGYVKHSEENGYVTYAPGEITKYGVIPPKYSSSEEYPFVLFHNGVCAYGGTTLAGTGGKRRRQKADAQQYRQQYGFFRFHEKRPHRNSIRIVIIIIFWNCIVCDTPPSPLSSYGKRR